MSPAQIMTPASLKTPELCLRVSKARILVKVLEVEATALASPHTPLLIEVLALIVAGPGLAPVSLPVTSLT